jgi:hypothetical protein
VTSSVRRQPGSTAPAITEASRTVIRSIPWSPSVTFFTSGCRQLMSSTIRPRFVAPGRSPA